MVNNVYNSNDGSFLGVFCQIGLHTYVFCDFYIASHFLNLFDYYWLVVGFVLS
jgi:hypothetical protein